METITINDVAYSVDDLSPGTIDLINRAQVLNSRISEAKSTIVELEALVGMYSDKIIESLPTDEPQGELEI